MYDLTGTNRLFGTEGCSGEGLCLLLKECGIGDHLQSLPIIIELAKKTKVTIYCNPFVFPLYKNVNVELFSERDILPGFTKKNLDKYENIYSLMQWGLDAEIQSFNCPDRTTFFGSLFGIERPKEFSWVEYFGLPERNVQEYIVYAPQASGVLGNKMRAYPYQLNTYLSLRESVETKWIGFPQHKYRRAVDTFDELVDLIYNAEGVLSVDTGIMHLAMSLGVPTFALFGSTNEYEVCEPYLYYLPEARRSILRTAGESCRPCNGSPERGYGVNGKCVFGAQCMKEFNGDEVANHFLSFIGVNNGYRISRNEPEFARG